MQAENGSGFESLMDAKGSRARHGSCSDTFPGGFQDSLAMEVAVRLGVLAVATFLNLAAVNKMFAERLLGQSRTWRNMLRACCDSSPSAKALYGHLLQGGACSLGALRQAVLEQRLVETQAQKWAAASGKTASKAKVFSFAVGLRARPFELEHMKVLDDGKVITVTPEMLQSMYRHVLKGMPATKAVARRTRLQGSSSQSHTGSAISPRATRGKRTPPHIPSGAGSRPGSARSGGRQKASAGPTSSLQTSSAPSTPRASARMQQHSSLSALRPASPAGAGQAAEDAGAQNLAKRLNITTIITDVNKSIHSATVQQAGMGPVKVRFPSGGVFDGGADQDEVFRRFAMPLLEQVHAGTNACLMCYGQTGSGKTHSMTGSLEAVEMYTEVLLDPAVARIEHGLHMAAACGHEEWGSSGIADMALPAPSGDCGIIPRALYTLFRWKYSLSHLQKYSVYIRTWEVDSAKDQPAKSGTRTVGTLGTAMAALLAGMKARSTAATRMNAQSSRSHLFVQVQLEQELLSKPGAHSTTGDSISASAYFVDLAGSERMSTAHGDAPIRALGGACTHKMLEHAGEIRLPSSFKKTQQFHETGRFSEMTTINSGLTTLGRVVRALATGASHVPYKDSNLTEALYPVFKGNCRTALLVNVSQHPADGAESLASMRFGERMACIKVQVKQQFQSAAEKEQRTRYFHLLVSDTKAQYNTLRRTAIRAHLQRLETRAQQTGMQLSEAAQADAFRQAVGDGSIPPELPSSTTKQWAETAETDRRFRADMSTAQRLAFEYYRNAAGLTAAAGSMYGEALARTPLHPSPQEAAAMCTGNLGRLLLKAKVPVDSAVLRSGSEPAARVLSHAKTHVTRPKTKTKPTGGGGAAAGAGAAAAESAVPSRRASRGAPGASSVATRRDIDQRVRRNIAAANAGQRMAGSPRSATSETPDAQADSPSSRRPGWRKARMEQIRRRS